MSGPVRIIAWGNLGRRDDGVALALAARLGERYAGRPDVVVQEYHQLGPELVDDLGDCRLAIFVDAHVRADAGEVLCEPLRPAESGGLDTHHCPPDILLGLTIAMGLPAPESWLVGIRAHDMDFGDEFSPATHQAMLVAEARIIALIQPRLDGGSTNGTALQG